MSTRVAKRNELAKSRLPKIPGHEPAEKLIDLATEHDIWINFVPGAIDNVWTWKSKKVKLADRSNAQVVCADMISDLAHELAHYFVASPDRRKKNDFGLGPAPESEKYNTKLLVGAKESDKEEEEASLLGMFIEASVGHDPGFTWCYHEWGYQFSPDLQHFDGVLGRLCAAGLVEGEAKLEDWEDIPMSNRYLLRKTAFLHFKLNLR